MCGREPRIDCLHFGLRLRDRHTGLEPQIRLEHVDAALSCRRRIRDAQRGKGIRRVMRKPKIRRHHAHHRVKVAAQSDLLADRRRIAAKLAHPECVAQHHHGRCAENVVLSADHPAQLGPRAQHAVHLRVARNHEERHRLRAAGIIEALHRAAADQFEGSGLRANVVEVWKRFVACECHESIRSGIWQRTQQHGIHHAKNRGIRADAKRQSKNRHRRKSR